MAIRPVTIQELEAYFADSLTPEAVRERWRLCLDRNAGDGFQAITINESPCPAETIINSFSFKLPQRVQLWGHHGADQVLEELKSFDLVRRGSFFGYRVEGELVFHPTERSVITFYFQVYDVPKKVYRLPDFDSYFSSLATDAALLELWTILKGYEADKESITVDVCEPPMSAQELHQTYSGRIPKLKERCGCYGDEQFLDSLKKLDQIRLGSAHSKSINGIMAFHTQEPVVLAFFFWTPNRF